MSDMKRWVAMWTAGLLVGSAAAAVAETRGLTAHDSGQYGRAIWLDAGTEVADESNAARVRRLDFAIQNVFFRSDTLYDKLDEYIGRIREEVEAGLSYSPAKRMLIRIDFWGTDENQKPRAGADRYLGDTQEVEVYARRLDAVLDRLGPVLPELVGISLSEENVPRGGRTWVLQALYEHIKARHPDLPVYQWWLPNTAVPERYEGVYLAADGWVGHRYTLTPEKYPHARYKMGPDPYLRAMQKVSLTGLPFIAVAWASDERPYYYQPEDPRNDFGDMAEILDHQLRLHRAFNYPTAFYWKNEPGAYTFGLGDASGLATAINQRVLRHIEESKALPDDWVGDPEISDRWENPPILLKGKGGLRFEEHFTRSHFLDQTSGTGLRDLVWRGHDLKARGYEGRPTDASILYRFDCSSPLASPTVLLEARVREDLKGRVTLRLSADGGMTWPATIATPSRSGTHRLTLSTRDRPGFEQISHLWIAIDLEGEAGSVSEPPCVVDELVLFSGAIPQPFRFEREADATPIIVKPSTREPLLEEHFTDPGFEASFGGAGLDALKWRDGALTLQPKSGEQTTTLVYQLQSEAEVLWPRVAINATAPQGAGEVRVRLSADRGATWPVTAQTQPDEPGTRRLVAETWRRDDFRAVRELWVAIDLVAGADPFAQPNLSIDELLVTSANPNEPAE